MGGIDEWLERLSWIALILLPVVVAVATYVVLSRFKAVAQEVGDALQEINTSRLLELLRLIEDPGLRDARSTVLIDIRRREQQRENWWETDDRLYRAAEQLCTSYDFIGGVVNFDPSGPVGQFFLETWGEDVLRIHEILERFLRFRRQSGGGPCSEFTWLVQEAKLIHRTPAPPKPEHPVRTVIRHLQS